ncbi:hypothetical protein NQZ68_004911 [Dissostichus eleginoides]|nr:hypothetical protein NQZ68_004911 [Dissostichus eleginoides]
MSIDSLTLSQKKLILMGISEDLQQMKSAPEAMLRLSGSLFVRLTVITLIELFLLHCPAPSFCLDTK